MTESPPAGTNRASNEDRERAVDAISDAAARGLLTFAEHEERVGRALQATTVADLGGLTADLARPPSATAPSRRAPSRWVVSVMGGHDRRGRWRVGRRLNVVAVMGGSDLDLRNAELDARELTITAVSIMGGSTIYVPDSAELDLGGFALMGGNHQRGSNRPARPGAPVVRVRAYSLMGGTDVWRLPVDGRDLSLKEARRAAKQLERGTRQLER